MTTKIQWTDTTENPISLIKPDGSHGGHWCQKLSPGCANCYAETINQSGYFAFASHLPYSGPAPENLRFDQKIIDRWVNSRRAQKRFVCSMTDLFGDWVPMEWQFAVFDAAAAAPDQTIQLLTKRPEIALHSMAEWSALRHQPGLPSNIWMGVSIEDAKTATDRLEACRTWALYCDIPWISYEPALSAVNFRPYFEAGFRWIVMGGESGPGARECNLEWLGRVVLDARSCDVAPFVKQLGQKPVTIVFADTLGARSLKFPTRDRKGGDITEFPIGLQVREFPA